MSAFETGKTKVNEQPLHSKKEPGVPNQRGSVSKQRFDVILLVVETTEESMQAARWAIGLAQFYEARLIGLNVVDRTVIVHLQRLSGKKLSEIEVEVEENGWKYLYHIESMAIERNVSVFLAQEEGLPEDEIIKKARTVGADLIVVGPPKAGGRWRPRSARYVEKLIEEAPCAVLIAK